MLEIIFNSIQYKYKKLLYKKKGKEQGDSPLNTDYRLPNTDYLKKSLTLAIIW